MSDVTYTGVEPKRLAVVLDDRRRKRGMTYQALADTLDMSVGSIHNLMTGDHTYPAPLLSRVAAALGWSDLELAFAVEASKVEDSPLMRRIGTLIRKAKAERDGGAERSST